MEKNNIIFEHWRTFAGLTDGRQHEYFEKKLKDGHTVKCVSVKDVFTSDELRAIKTYCDIEPKMCYRTAYKLTNLFPERVKYVEGEVTIFNGALGIEHAWNLVDGEHYVDLTFELALGEDVARTNYVALGEYDLRTVRNVASKTKLYGGVYDYHHINEIKERERKTKNKKKK